MHQYKLALTQYSESGALTNIKSEVYCDSPEQLAIQYRKYNQMRYTNEDGSVGMRMYQVKPMLAAYNEISDLAGLLAFYGIVI